MKVFAISDLHLSHHTPKAMDIFGSHWEGHFEKICEDWLQKVGPEDLVLIAGDISWAMQLKDAKADLEAIGRLPGFKAILRGNHDYWWNGITQVRSVLPAGMQAVQNDCLVYDEVVVCGSRGWTPVPPEGNLGPDDQKIFNRELMRMELSLEKGAKAAQGRPLVVMMHYPPMNEKWEDSDFTRLFEKYGVSQVIYGHLHGGSVRGAYNGERNGVNYQLTSCDGLGFRLWACPELKG